MKNVPCLDRSATLDDTGIYRYSLSRVWNRDLPTIAWVMLNPSVATGDVDDATLKKCMGFSSRWGYGGLCLVNLFAFISTNPDVLGTLSAAVAIGEKNDQNILEAVSKAASVLIAWGNQGNLFQRDRAVLTLLKGFPLYCLGTTNSNQPKHPVRLAYETRRVRFVPVGNAGPSSPSERVLFEDVTTRHLQPGSSPLL